MTPAIVIVRGGQVASPDGVIQADVLIESGKVVAIDAKVAAPKGATVIDAGGCIVSPGFVDLHTHLREPGNPEAETVESGARAAALGGYTAIVAMPNTEPALDSAPAISHVLELGRHVPCRVFAAGAITIGRKGAELAPLGEMADAGARFFTDDGAGVQDANLMRRAFEYALPIGLPLAQHCEDYALAAGGQMHEGAVSSRLGIPGMSALAEEAMVARDLELARVTGGKLHLLHLSTARSVELVKSAKEAGVDVTCEVAPHHLLLTEERVANFDPLFKVNPPLRPESDVEQLRKAACADHIDAIATDHAPHPPESKQEPFAEAPPGMLGLETALAVAWTTLRQSPAGHPHPGGLTIEQLIQLLSIRPAAIAGLQPEQGMLLRRGANANLCIFDSEEEWTVSSSGLASRSRNTPFAGMTFTGKVRHTILDGEPVVIDGIALR